MILDIERIIILSYFFYEYAFVFLISWKLKILRIEIYTNCTILICFE